MIETFIGIDPDLHHTGIAIVDPFGRVLEVECAKVSTSLRGAKAVAAMSDELLCSMKYHAETYARTVRAAVEGQTISFRQTKDPSSILHLAHVTGCAVSALRAHTLASVYIPAPREWKGQVPKQIHHQRICERLVWAYTLHGTKKSGYASPNDPPVGKHLKPSQWKHVLDAVGLALWAAEKHAREERVAPTSRG